MAHTTANNERKACLAELPWMSIFMVLSASLARLGSGLRYFATGFAALTPDNG